MVILLLLLLQLVTGTSGNNSKSYKINLIDTRDTLTSLQGEAFTRVLMVLLLHILLLTVFSLSQRLFGVRLTNIMFHVSVM